MAITSIIASSVILTESCDCSEGKSTLQTANTAPIVSVATTKGYGIETTTGSRTSSATTIQAISNAAVGNARFRWEGIGVMIMVLGFVGGTL